MLIAHDKRVLLTNNQCVSYAFLSLKVLCSEHSRHRKEVYEISFDMFHMIQVGQKRWRVDTNSRLNSILMLSSVNLPGGELRRRSAEDELLMREYLTEGDLISVSVLLVGDKILSRGYRFHDLMWVILCLLWGRITELLELAQQD